MIPQLLRPLGCAALACGTQPQSVFPYEYSQEDLPNGLRRFALVTRNGEDLKRQLASEDASPMTYYSPKPKEITREDLLVVNWPLGVKAEGIKVRPLGEVFQ